MLRQKQVKQEINHYIKTKKKLVKQLEEQRLQQNKSFEVKSHKIKKYQTALSRANHERDKELEIRNFVFHCLVQKLEQQKAKEHAVKRKMYADQVKKLSPVKVSDKKRQELIDFIEEQNKPATEKVQKIKRKKGGYYSIKMIKR